MILLFLLYCVAWSAYSALRYEPFRAGFPVGSNTVEEDGIEYGVYRHGFPAWTGNLSIGPKQKVDRGRPEEVGVSLIIWPRGLHDYEVAAWFWELVPDESGTMQVSVRHAAMLDAQMKLTDSVENTPETRRLYGENMSKIEELYRLAQERWGILEVE
ncbi:MAG: hypothetical protein J6M66_02410 [Lachnospiraceae bacterium]|nr:hypothetical protein [Lachnospiraceae bacterium]